MKNTLAFIILFGIISNFICENSLSQSIARTWSVNNPFKTDVFVENFGQFDSWAKTPVPIKYAVNSSDKIFFTQLGLTFKVNKNEILSEEEREELERNKGKEAVSDIYTFYVNMQWDGCNKNTAMEVSEESEGYYTFGEKGYENVKAKGYKKLTYKNLYDGIDVEYYIPDKGGIKYSLILHPGADVSKVKMKYTGNIDKIEISAEGNILIKTPAGDIIDHTPHSFYKATSETIRSFFKLEEKIVSFQLQAPQSKSQTIIIDPWTQSPSSLVADNAAYDVDVDDRGNIYISGGTAPFKLAKYSSTGTILWTFTNPVGWATGGSSYYSKFSILPTSGSIFFGEAFSVTGPRVMKISNSGSLIYTTPNFSGTQEIWLMFYNRCNGKLISFGGGNNNSNNMQIVADTNLTGSTTKKFNSNTNARNDIAAVEQDYNGDFYALISSLDSNVNGLIMKSLSFFNYNPPVAWTTNTMYDFYEYYNFGISGLNGVTVRANSLAVNSNYLFSYDGKTLNAWNKSTGASLGSVVVDVSYIDGKDRTHEGIDADECNNVYVGGTNKVHVYSFNGSSFTSQPSITTDISGDVYCVKYDQLKELIYISGLGFITTVSAIKCDINPLIISDTIDPCVGNVSISIIGGVSPYAYQWSNGLTTSNVNGLTPGNYTVTVSDKSCIPYIRIDSITVPALLATSISTTLAGCELSDGTATVTASGGASPFTYLWSQSGTDSTATGLAAGQYAYTVIDANGCSKTDNVDIFNYNAPISSAIQVNVKCHGDSTGSINLIVSGGMGTYTYNWNNGTYITEDLNNLPAGIYSYIVTDSVNCKSVDTVVVSEPDTILLSLLATNILCHGDSTGLINLTVSGGTGTYTYDWMPNGYMGDSTTTYLNLIIGTYNVIVTDTNSCTSSSSITITEPPALTAITSQSNVICNGYNTGTATVTGVGGTPDYDYLWSNAQVNDTTINLVEGTYVVTVTDANNCTYTTSVTITQPPLLTTSINTTYAGCELSDGTATVIASGGTGTYSYLWSTIPVQTTATATGLAAGSYVVTITDTNGCFKTDNVNIANYGVPIASTTQVNIMCNGLSTGSIDLTVSGGTGLYTYNWSSGATTEDLNNIAAGTYSFTITDSVNCKKTGSVTIIQPDTLIASSVATNILCHGDTANIIITSTGGTGIVSGTGIFLEVAGTYNYTVTDVNGCTSSTNITVPQPDTLIASSSATNILCHGDYSFVSVISTGGTGIVTGTGFYSVNAGNYTYTVTDANGCTSIVSGSVSEPADISILTNAIDPTCNGNNGSVSIQVNGGTLPYTYLWSNNDNDSLVSGLFAGNYTVTVTDKNNCIKISTTSLYSPPSLAIDTSYGINNYMGYINIIVSGGSIPYAFNWSNGSVANNLTDLPSGTYTVTVTDAQNCTLTETFIIDIPLIIPSVITPNEDGINDNFQIVGIESYRDVSIEIYNRWGDILFIYSGTGMSYHDPLNRWNGEHNGKKLPMGSYVYIIKLGEDIDPITGVVSIVR